MIEKFRSPAFWLGIFGVVKLLLQAFGIDIVSDREIDSIANGIAAVFTVVGVYASHKPKLSRAPLGASDVPTEIAPEK